MDQTRQMAEQHILAWQSRLKHIDELMVKAQAARAQTAETLSLETALTQARQHRDRLAGHLAQVEGQVQAQPAEALPALVKHGEGLQGALEAAGLQLEQALTAVLR
jgi:hypothetical protein